MIKKKTNKTKQNKTKKTEENGKRTELSIRLGNKNMVVITTWSHGEVSLYKTLSLNGLAK